MLRTAAMRRCFGLLIIFVMYAHHRQLYEPAPESFTQLISTLFLWKKLSTLQPIRQRLNNGGQAATWQSEDRLARMINRPYEFFQMSGETTESFNDLLLKVQANLPRLPIKITASNKLLMCMIWLRSYPTCAYLSVLFQVSITDVWRCISSTWPVLYESVRDEIKWPSEDEWIHLRNNWTELPGVVGAIDGCSHEIQQPTEDQHVYYSGCRKFHCVHSQVIIDNELNIRYISSGYAGHFNDAQTYRKIPRIGENLDLNLPGNCWLLADKIYPCEKPLITPYRRNQIPRNNQDEALRRRYLNDSITRHRVYVEHVIGRIKQFRVIGTVYRHDISDLKDIVRLCACLTQRRYKLFDEF